MKLCKEIVVEHCLFWPIFGVYIASVYVGTTSFGAWAASAVGIVAVAIVGAYGEKLRRYHARVRYRVGKLQRTGDGGEDCWTVLLRKRWANLLTHPFSHVFKPAPGLEMTIDCGGYATGSVRLFERPMTVIAAHEKFVVGIGHADYTAECAGQLMQEIEELSAEVGVNVEDYIDKDYDDVPQGIRDSGRFPEEQFYKLLGFYIMDRDGLQFVRPGWRTRLD